MLSPFTAFTHSRRFSAFVLSGFATHGVQNVAEIGDNSVLIEELQAETAAPFIHSMATNDAPIFDGDTFTAELEVNCEYTRISFISMVAPSPDWFIGVDNMNLFQGGFFIDRAEGDLFVYDAGTDSGTTFDAPDEVTDPQQNIAPLNGEPFNGVPVASYVIEKVVPECPTASYELTFINQLTEPTFENLPETAMLSPLTGASHNYRFSALVRFGFATQGVQNVAEIGDNTVLIEELESEEAAPFVLSIDAADAPATRGESFSINLDVDCDHTLITAISMVAPSPDWFITIPNMNVLVDGRFIVGRSGTLRVYDAGTDSGETFEAEDLVTDPRENIAPLIGEPFNGIPVAQYVLRRTA